jgi:quinol monooxygenase YgiN
VSEVVVVAIVRPRPGFEARVEEAFLGLVAPTHAEDGCELYALHRDRNAPGRLVFVERWSSLAALQAHAGSEHLAANAERVADMLESPVEVMVLDPLPGGDPVKGVL